MDAITYAMSKKYTDNKVAVSTGLHREIVNSLPSTGDNNTIYMVLDPNASSPDIYDEWLWVNGAYEHIGSTRVDLTDYYNKTQVDTALNGKANVATTLSGYGITDAYTKTETDTSLSGKASTSDIPTALSSLSDDATHRLVTDTEKNTWNGKSNFSGSYNDLSNKPTIPTALSDLTDDSTHRVVTDTEKSTWNGKANSATTLAGYGITNAYTKSEVDTALSSKAGVFSTYTFLNTSSFSIPSHDAYGFNMDISKSGRTAIAIMGILGVNGRMPTGLSIADFYISHPNPHNSTESRIMIDFYNGSNSTVSIREDGIEFTILYSEGLLGD